MHTLHYLSRQRARESELCSRFYVRFTLVDKCSCVLIIRILFEWVLTSTCPLPPIITLPKGTRTIIPRSDCDKTKKEEKKNQH